MIPWLSKHKYEAHTAAFLLMMAPPVFLYMAAQRGLVIWIWILLGLVILGNLLALLTR